MVFDTLLEARVLIERWLREYNTIRPHGALGYAPPAPEARVPQPAEEKRAPGIPSECAAALT
jgi:transposase InsO family protein